jgi:hypothetical protein
MDDAIVADVRDDLKAKLGFPGDVTITKLEPKRP